MKKSIFLVCLVLCFMASSVSQAQNQYYFNEGDTIYGRDTTYFYQWWSDQWLASSPTNKIRLWPSTFTSPFHGRVLQLNYTNLPINVVGIATSFYNYYLTNFHSPSDIPPESQEYVLLYEADTSRLQFYEVGRIPIDYTRPARYMNIDQRYNDNECCNIAPDTSDIIKIREYYFDKPITVSDSYYVGHTLNSNYWPDPEHTGDWFYYVTCWAYHYVADTSLNNCPYSETNCNTLPLQQYKFKQDDYWLGPNALIDSSVWYYYRIPQLAIEFPIIEIDSSFFDGPPQYVCPQVQNFRIAQAAEGTVVFLWDTHSDHQSWQLSYGPSGTAPDDGIVINCPMQVGQIMGLDSCTDYVAYIRAVCDHDSIVFSEWSDSLVVNICDTTGGGGTESIGGNLGQFTQIIPNPASDEVQVLSSFEIRSVEVFDLQGRTVLRSETEGHTASLRLGDVSSGLYVAVVHTSAGNFAKKLVIQH